MKKPELTVVIPTFNELENIDIVTQRLEATLSSINFEILFVDDNSNDGTVKAIRSLETEKHNVSLLLRIGRRGLAGACIEGMLAARSEFIAVIDCDLQHDETKLLEMLSQFRKRPTLDLVVGSRHLSGGRVTNGFSVFRQYGSQLTTWLTKRLLNIQINDPMSGFFMVKKTSILTVIDKLQPNGFKILADIIASSSKKWEIVEVNYNFRSRASGKSKMNLVIVFELLGLLLSHLSFGLLSIRFILFGIVGVSGIFVQLFSTFLFLNFFSLPYFFANSVGVFIAMTSNYYLNNRLTYKDRSLSGKSYLKGLLSFYFVCSAGALANIAVADFIFRNTGIWSLASLSGALLGALWNFTLSSIFTWRTR